MKDYTIYVTEEIARKAIEKGFKGHFVGIIEPLPNIFESKDHYHYFIPTAEQICGWLREEKDIFVDLTLVSPYQYEWIIYDYSNVVATSTECQDYRAALFEGISKALELL